MQTAGAAASLEQPLRRRVGRRKPNLGVGDAGGFAASREDLRVFGVRQRFGRSAEEGNETCDLRQPRRAIVEARSIDQAGRGMGAGQARDDRRKVDLGESPHRALHYLNDVAGGPGVFVTEGVDRDRRIARTSRRRSEGARRNGGQQQHGPPVHAARLE